MPDADIPPVVLKNVDIAEMQKDMPTLPPEYRKQFKTLEVDSSVVRTILRDKNVARLVSEILRASGADIARRVANLFASTLPTEDENAGAADANDAVASGLVGPARLIELAEMARDNKISSTAAKELFLDLFDKKHAGKLVSEIAKTKNLLQLSDQSAIAAIVDQVLAQPESQKAIADIRAGEDKAIGFLVGLVMKQSKGQANPALAQKLIRQKLQ
jgi:aspartyl-tRNA(Asn)/glutamyl-tRNA(Gln) amidotransferase subunit B